MRVLFIQYAHATIVIHRNFDSQCLEILLLGVMGDPSLCLKRSLDLAVVKLPKDKFH